MTKTETEELVGQETKRERNREDRGYVTKRESAEIVGKKTKRERNIEDRGKGEDGRDRED